MKIGIIGTGYVGLVQGVVFANFGFPVLCMDKDEAKIHKLSRGIPPIHESGLQEMLSKNLEKNRLVFTNDIRKLTKESDVIFICVGTPSKEDGSVDLQYVLDVARSIGENINHYKVIVNKSTVPIGTAQQVESIILDSMEKNNNNFEFDVVSNPEFLREGNAIFDSINPDRIVIGSNSEKAMKIMGDIYSVFKINKTPIIFTKRETAEMIKYASNAFLAVKISFINEMALLSEKVGADIQEIAIGMGMDGRISPKFLHAGPGYGGSCFPKDTKAIVDMGKKYNEEMYVIDAAIRANEKQKVKVTQKIINLLKDNKDNKIVTIWGLSFKPGTDDARDAPSLDIIKELIHNNYHINAYCPMGIDDAQKSLDKYNKNITYFDDEYSAAVDSSAIVLVTEWNQFRGFDAESLRDKLYGDLFIDLRNAVFKRKNELERYFKYYGIGVK